MSIEHVVDAHALIWFLGNDPQLGARARDVFLNPASSLVIPAIALAETCWSAMKRRTNNLSPEVVLRAIDSDPRIKIAPLTREIIEMTLSMPAQIEMHDRQIVATALLLQNGGRSVALLTKDEVIVASALVPVLC